MFSYNKLIVLRLQVSVGNLTLGDFDRTSVAAFVCLGMVKTTRKEGENLGRSPRLTSSASPRLREEEQVASASQTCSSGPRKGDTPETVDLTGRPKSKLMVPSQQSALSLVASAGTKDSGRQLPSAAIAVNQQIACMKSTYVNKSIVSLSGTAFKYIKHFSAPAQEPVPHARATEEPSTLSVARTNPLKMEAAPSAAAGSPGNPRGSDGPSRNSRGSGSKTNDLRTVSALGEAIGTRGTSASEGNLRGSDSSRLLGTTSALGEALGSCTSAARALREALGSGTSTASSLGEALGSGTLTSKENPRRSDDPSRERTPARESVS